MEQERRNLAAAEGYERTVAEFGGEAALRERYPRILKMLQDTREMRRLGGSAGAAEGEASEGYENSYRINQSTVYEECGQIGMWVKSRMSMVNKSSMLCMTSRTYDAASGKVFASYSEYSDDAAVLEKETLVDHSYAAYTEHLKVATETTYYSVENVNGKSVLAEDPVVRRVETDLSVLKPIVSGITVQQPKEREGADRIRVVYNGRQDDKAAYNFKAAKDYTYWNIRWVDVYYPFLVEIELAEDKNEFRFDGEHPVDFSKDFYMSLYSEVVNGGEVHFNTANTRNIKWELTGTRKLLVDFRYDGEGNKNDWGVRMPLTDSQAQGEFHFHLNFAIYYTDKYKHQYKTDIIVTSESIPASDNMRKVKTSHIQWGCIGGEVLIRTSEGDKKVSELAVGDMVYTERGYKRLVNLVSGTEEEMVAISVEGCERLLLTAKHAILAERGVIEAGDLRPDDRVRLADGSYAAIGKLERVPYDGKVYSPELEQSEMICANRIMVGDYLMRPEAEEPEASPEPEAIDPELRRELIEWMQEWERRAQQDGPGNGEEAGS